MPWALSRERLAQLSPDEIGRYRDVVDVILNMDKNLGILSKLNSLSRGFNARTVTIGTTPTLIHSSPQGRGILLFNPTLSSGITTSGTILASGTHAASNTQATPLSVANFERLSLFLNITITGGATNTITVQAQSQDQLSLGWATTQSDLFSAATNYAVGTYYVNLGTLGIDVSFAVQWLIGAGTPTWSLGYTLKDGLPGTSGGVASTVYLGASDGVSTSSGFPLFSGDKLPIVITESTELWGVALAAGQAVRVFELS
jgi:hypothetical protein